MRRRRALLLDASCVIAGSHNPRACRLFARAFETRGFAARYVIPCHGEAVFPGEAAAVERVLPYPYARRYGTIDALADDIERYLEHRPVEARGRDVWYRVVKGAVRHRMAVSAGAAAYHARSDTGASTGPSVSTAPMSAAAETRTPATIGWSAVMVTV